MTLQSELQGPKRGADRAVLLAHGAGADMHATALTTVADALAAAKIPSLRFNFPYMAAGRRGPDRPPVLEAAVREAAVELAAQAKVPLDRIVLGGRSMGGRIASVVAADPDDPLPALGLVLLGYPLHPPGKPQTLRTEHFPRIRVPCLFVSGSWEARGRRVSDPRLLLDGSAQTPVLTGIPIGGADRDSGFCGILAVSPVERPRRAALELEASIEGAARERQSLGEIELVPALARPEGSPPPGSGNESWCSYL